MQLAGASSEERVGRCLGSREDGRTIFQCTPAAPPSIPPTLVAIPRPPRDTPTWHTYLLDNSMGQTHAVIVLTKARGLMYNPGSGLRSHVPIGEHAEGPLLLHGSKEGEQRDIFLPRQLRSWARKGGKMRTVSRRGRLECVS